MRWFFAVLLIMEGVFVHQAFYSSSKILNVVGFFCLVPTSLALLFFLLVGLFMLIAVPMGWMGSASDYIGLARRRPDDEMEEEAQTRKKSGWRLPDLSDPTEPLSSFNSGNQEMLRPIHVEHDSIHHF